MKRVGKGTVNCDSICDTDIFTTNTCAETFKIQTEIFNCNSQKVIYLSKYTICGQAPYGKLLMMLLRARFDNYKSAHRSY